MASILQLLAQKMGKSSDEVLEALGKKAATTGDEVSEAATMANLQREAADAVQPMGSGKNLDALQSNPSSQMHRFLLILPYQQILVQKSHQYHISNFHLQQYFL